MDSETFTETLSGIYESSPWVPQKAFDSSPFENFQSLARTLREIVMQASRQNKLELIKAHPDLGGKLGIKTELTPESQREQSRLSLNALDKAEYAKFTELNQGYRSKFGFPFIICVGKIRDRQEILDAFESRLNLPLEEEFEEALSQIHQIAQLRLEALLTE